MMLDTSELAQRAEDNDRLRREVVRELEATRGELSALVQELNRAQSDALTLAGKLADRDVVLQQLVDTHAAEKSELNTTINELKRQLENQQTAKRPLSTPARPARSLAVRAKSFAKRHFTGSSPSN
ncbi:hypothetical protein H5392_02980 [Tessaracoccus sp. MC1865]|uniref:hypothetical protein n=1 Tax=Tessaracoccus sp. MC1865 TaxID=2760310 RepID=UPI00160154AB|nr:hypothetical protein [Tessaracoccus sp. MC1865]MBB1482823.1 hypothetical protein [Tessaracoccus sp. MC1865]QTO37737.1 hypothetical protein J7D54_01110 [Tessaracoccus sp. MC1865]